MDPANAGKETASSAAPAEQSSETEKQTLLGATEQPKQSGQPGEKPADAKEEKPAAKVAFDLKVPQGAEFDTAHVDGLKKFAEANGLTPDAAQKVLERDAALVTARQEASLKDWHERQVPEWKNEIKADKKIGGDNYAETDRLATLAIAKFWPPGSLKKLTESGFAFEPDFVRAMRAVGASISEPKGLPPGTPSPTQGNKLAALYNNPSSAPLFAGVAAAKE